MTTEPFGDFTSLAALLLRLERLREAALDIDLVWVLPDEVLPGMTQAYGLPVIRAAVPHPLLAHG